MSKDYIGLRVMRAAFYWTGVILAVGCGLIILIEHTTVLHHFERDDLPPALVVGALAILAFAIGEYLNSVLVEGIKKDRPLKSALRRAETEPLKERDLPAVPLAEHSRPIEVQPDHRNLLPDQIAALSEAMNLLDEVRDRVESRDIRAAMPLISDTRQRIASVIAGEHRQPRFHLSHPTRA